ncbi:hypothetical protein TNCV_1155501 [Trichonephila clavipes]|nr:hypothetical protein TNCV_1155501 [Trichonephila clavipes]
MMVTNSYYRVQVPLKTHRVEAPLHLKSVKARCLSIGVVIGVGRRCQIKHLTPPRHLTDVQNYEVHRQLPSSCFIVRR